MNLIQQVGAFLMAGSVQAFNKQYFSVNQPSIFESYNARLLRYTVNEAFYENTAYSDIHSLFAGYKVQEGLYKYIRPIYNPAHQVIRFYQSVIWPGILDKAAGDAGAIPLTVGEGADDDKLRAAIAQVWVNSNWKDNKGVHVLRGSNLGDSILYIRDDLHRGDVSIEVLHPSSVKEIEMDKRGFVRSYKIEEKRFTEDGKTSYVYTETCEHGEGENIEYRTYKNNAPFAENTDNDGNSRSSWSEPYGFIPMVKVSHELSGLDWGLSAIHNEIPKFAQLDSLASHFYDEIHKEIDNPGLIAGASKPTARLAFETEDATTDNPQPGREQKNLLWIKDPSAHFQTMVGSIDVSAVTNEIQKLLEKIESDLPELNRDVWNAERKDGVKAARDMIANKVVSVRARYDNSVVYANQMSIAIGGMRGYEGFDGYNLDSYKSGALDHSVSERPVFTPDPTIEAENEMKIWTTAAAVARDSGGSIPVETVLLALGKTAEQIQDLGSQRLAAIKMMQEDTIPNDKP